MREGATSVRGTAAPPRTPPAAGPVTPPDGRRTAAPPRTLPDGRSRPSPFRRKRRGEGRRGATADGARRPRAFGWRGRTKVATKERPEVGPLRSLRTTEARPEAGIDNRIGPTSDTCSLRSPVILVRPLQSTPQPFSLWLEERRLSPDAA